MARDEWSHEESINGATDLTAEQWLRVTWEGAPRPLRGFLPLAWKFGLGLRLGSSADPARVLGWLVARSDRDLGHHRCRFMDDRRRELGEPRRGSSAMADHRDLQECHRSHGVDARATGPPEAHSADDGTRHSARHDHSSDLRDSRSRIEHADGDPAESAPTREQGWHPSCWSTAPCAVDGVGATSAAERRTTQHPRVRQ